MKTPLPGLALLSLLAAAPAFAQQASAPVIAAPAPAAQENDTRAPILPFAGLGENAPILLTGAAGIALIAGILALEDDDDSTVSSPASQRSGGDDGNAGNASDIRLKRDIRYLGTTGTGLRLHEWRYAGGQTAFTGVMAQEVLADPRHAHAVTRGADGFYRVDYRALGLAPADPEAMRREGDAALRAATR